jgi:hypothetical protein
MRYAAAVLSLLWVAEAISAPVAMPEECTKLLKATHPTWKTMRPDPEVAKWTHERGQNPVVARGDFDGNKQLDWATVGSIDGKAKLALCLTSAGRKSIVVTDDGGCSDYVNTIKRRTRVPNLDAGTEEVLRTDTISTSCFEKSARVFVYHAGTFRVFFISD